MHRKVRNIGAPDLVGPFDGDAAQQVRVDLVTRNRAAEIAFQTTIIISNSLSRGSGTPIQVDDVLLHAMSGTELSRVRTEL